MGTLAALQLCARQLRWLPHVVFGIWEYTLFVGTLCVTFPTNIASTYSYIGFQDYAFYVKQREIIWLNTLSLLPSPGLIVHLPCMHPVTSLHGVLKHARSVSVSLTL